MSKASLGLAWIVFAAAVCPVAAQDLTVQSFPLNNYKRVLDGQWQGIRHASDGNVYFGSSTHSAHHGASFFRYDPRTGQLTLLADDITTICGEDPQTNPQGKLHSDIVEANGWLYMSTHFAVDDKPGAFSGWTGAHVIGYQLSTGQFRDYGVIHPNATSYSGIAVDPVRNYLYVFVAAGSGAYVYRVDTASGSKVNLGQVGHGAQGSFYFFIDQRGDVWFSMSHANGELRRIRGATGQMDVYSNVLPQLYLWNTGQIDPSALNQSQRWIFWMQKLDGDRAVFTMGFNGGLLYLFDSSKPIGSGQEFTPLRHIGYTNLGLALGNNRVFYYQRANRGFGHQDFTDFHLLSVSLDAATGHAITDHGLIKDQDGRLVWRAPGMMTDGGSRVFFVGDLWIKPGDLGTLRYQYNNGVESYVQLPRGQFFAVADLGSAPALTVRSTPVTGVAITGSHAGSTNYSASPSAGSAVTLNAPSSATSGGTAYSFAKWRLNGADQTGSALSFTSNSAAIAEAVYVPLSVSVSPGSATLGQGQPQQFTANTPVVWTIAPPVGSVSATGLYTAPGTISSAQTVTVTGASTTDAARLASATVTLLPPVTASPSSATLGSGQSQQFTANIPVTWSLNPSVGTITAAGLYTAPANIAVSQTVSVIATSTQDPARTATATAMLTPPLSGGSVVRINCGGADAPYTDTSGRTWSTDRFFSGGGVGYSSTMSGTNASDSWLYRTARMGAWANFQYSIPVIPGNYRVNLKFAELYSTAVGQRVFHVDINGARVLANFDILGEVAAKSALDKSFATSAAAGFVNLVFTGVVNQGTVSAIEIVPDDGAPLTVTVSPGSATLEQGASQQFTANVPVTWSALPAVGAISPTGLYTAPASIASQQTVTVTATSTQDPSKSASATVTLTPPAVTVSPGSATLGQGASQQFTANVPVTWSVLPAVGAISPAGLYSAPTSIASQHTVTVTATSTQDPSKSASATVTLTPPAITVTVSPQAATLGQGASQQFTANVPVTWSVLPAVGAISPTGLYTAPASIASQQTVTVTATSTQDASKSATAMVTLTPPAITVNVSPANATLGPSQTQQFAANVPVSWSINPSTGSISSTGLYSAPASIAAQQTITLTATSTEDPTKFRNVTATLAPPAPIVVTVSPGSATLGQGAYQQFSASVPVTWSIQPAVGSITAAGLYVAPTSIANQQNVIVTATSTQDPSKSATAQVTLTPPPAPTVSPSTVSLGPSQSQQFTSNQPVTWTIAPSVGSITASGLYTAPSSISGIQTVTITAASNADPARTAAATVTLTSLAPGSSVVRINCGGADGPYTDPSGSVWSADRYFSGTSANGYSGFVAGTNTMWLYQTARMGTSSGFVYTIPVSPGSYQVTLKFAELYASSRGQRVFHVTINGTRVLSNFDILSVVPVRTATDRSFAVAAPGGSVTIAFDGVAGQGTVSAIEIKPAP